LVSRTQTSTLSSNSALCLSELRHGSDRGVLDRVRVNANIATLGTSSVSQGHHNGVVNSAPQSKRIRYSVPRVLDCGVLVGGNLGRAGFRSCRIKTLYSRLTLTHGDTTPAGQNRPGACGANHQFGSRSEGTRSPRNHCVDTVKLRVEPWPQATLATSIRTSVSGYSSGTKIPKACAFITTTCTSNKRSATNPQCCPRY